jgi:hypothetical protein
MKIGSFNALLDQYPFRALGLNGRLAFVVKEREPGDSCSTKLASV